MGLSLRLFCLNGKVFVPDSVLKKLNERLHEDGRQPYEEPEDINCEEVQAACRFDEFQRYPSLGIPYSYIPRLRRVYTLHKLGLDWKSQQGQQAQLDAAYQNALNAQSEVIRNSHLVWHGDSEGIYLPIPLPEPMWFGPYAVGSAVALAKELDELAEPLIGVSGNGALDAYLASPYDPEDPWDGEKHAWAALREMARLSLSYKTALVFS